ncbi:thaumatin-like protein 1b [Prunus yedoensis var. nudiflora]|uniref:Thaumatin-like protein 1b n=1 Tax=Prunus yedoensis var. nudiflora TaxID=2094558 RepID=A0A314YY43_PRUYE|nr:thaumatin-like protein 1b [Prunus yedoensis var. nudiflora]
MDLNLMAIIHFSPLYITLILFTIFNGISGATFIIINKCDYTVWPGILSNAGSSRLDSTGLQLQPGTSRSFQSPPNWSGRFWARTGCNFDPTTGQGTCTTGDCGSNQVECNGAGAIPPATLAEFTIGGSDNQDFYDVSLVDGYNLPMMVEPSGGSGSCLSTGCATDLNQRCPAELRVGDGAACKSACEAFGSPEYCCNGAFGTPDTCKPSVYSEMFKAACPRSYSYAYDDASSTFTCTGADYTITFCPPTTSQKSASTSSTTSNGSGQTTTTTNNGSGGGSGTTGELPAVVGNSNSPPPWFPNFFTGDSTKTLSSSALYTSLVASSATLFLFLSLSLLHS